MNFTEVLQMHALQQPLRPAIIDGPTTVTYRELDALVSVVAANLRRAGIDVGDVVAVTLKDSSEYLIVMLALARTGAVMTGIESELPAADRREAAESTRTKAIVIGAPQDAIDGVQTVELAQLFQRTETVSSVPALGDDHPLTVVQSSGTTGTPKSFYWTHAAMRAQAIRHEKSFGWTAHDRYLAVVKMAFFWERELCFVLFHIGATVIVSRAPSPGRLADEARRHSVSILALTPSHLNMLLQLPMTEFPAFPTVRTLVVGSAPLAHERRLAVRAKLTPHFCEQLGTNEAGLLVLGTPADQDAEPAAIGRLAAGIEAQVVDQAGQPVPPGTVGLVGFRGPAFPTGYIDNPEATARGFRGGWFYPGDLAAIDARGFFHFKGRADDVINNQGAKFYPIEVEKVLLSHPAIAEAAVVGWPHPVLGEAAVAFVVVREPVTRLELEEFCLARLARFKQPAWYVFAKELPRNRNGKILKRQLKEMHGTLVPEAKADG
jgi:acyl-coenzyme A synthetase/AMP-(fatty) acid ligase